MDLKTSALSIAISPLIAAGAVNCIVSGSLERPATHSADSPAPSVAAFELRAGSSGSCAIAATPSDGFEARAWSRQDSATPRPLNCLPPATMIIFR